jgi:hypothetical protein
VFASLGGAVFLLVHRKLNAANTAAIVPASYDTSLQRHSEFDRLVTTMRANEERRFSNTPAAAPEREERREWPALH